jgi:hypothetical protein
MQPYLLAFGHQEVPETIKERSVIFAVMATAQNRTLFATCRHTHPLQARSFFYAVTERNEELTLPGDAKLFPSQKTELDLTFVELDIRVPAERMRFNEAPIQKGSSILHARNVLSKKGFPEGQVFQVSSANTERAAFRAVYTHAGTYSFLDWTGGFDEAKKQGMSVFYDVLEMQSWPGVSGSPLWDNFGAIRGMVCGGTDEEYPSTDGVPRLVYLPAKTILREALHVVKSLKSGSIMRLG